MGSVRGSVTPGQYQTTGRIVRDTQVCATLWGVPVDRVDFLAAHVADEERSVVGGQAGP